MKKGLFITFEGIDGSGKTTQARLLWQRLKEKEHPVIFTREPGGSEVKISEKIRNVILNHTSVEMTWKTELLLFMASRAQHIDELVVPNLSQGRIVICDRFADASVAYQGYGRGLDIEWIKQLNHFACGKAWPDITFLLDISPEDFLARKQLQNVQYDRIEGAGNEFQDKVRQGYLELSEQDPKRIICLEGSKTQEELSNEIYQKTKELL